MNFLSVHLKKAVQIYARQKDSKSLSSLKLVSLSFVNRELFSLNLYYVFQFTLAHFPLILFTALRHSVALITRSYQRPRQRQTPSKAASKKTATKVISNKRSSPRCLRHSNQRPPQALKRSARWWISSRITTYPSCLRRRNNHRRSQWTQQQTPISIRNQQMFSHQRERQPRQHRQWQLINFIIRTRFLRLFVIQLRRNVIAHLTTYHLILI